MDDEFKLCWKNFQDNIASGFQNLYDRGDLVDVTLACDGKLLHAHKFVLAICSPYFQEIFITNPCKHPIIILKDVTFNIMCELLEFMYQGVVNVKHTELQAFMKIGQLLQIKGLATNSASSAASTTSEKSSSQNAAKLDTDGKAEAISSTKANTTTTSGSTTTPTTNNSEENAGENSNSGKQTGSNSNPHTPVRSGSPALSSSSRMGVSINPTQPSNTTINKSSSDSSSHQSMHGGYHHSLTSGKRYFDYNSDTLSIHARNKLRRSLTSADHSSDNNDVSADGNSVEQINEDFFLPHISMVESRYDLNIKREAAEHHAAASLRNNFPSAAFGLDYNFYKSNSSSAGSGQPPVSQEQYPNDIHMPSDYSKNFGNHMDIPPNGSNMVMLSSTSLLHGNCVFNRNNTVATQQGMKTYWLCKSYRISMCRARCITHQGRIISATGVHNHTPHMRGGSNNAVGSNNGAGGGSGSGSGGGGSGSGAGNANNLGGNTNGGNSIGGALNENPQNPSSLINTNSSLYGSRYTQHSNTNMVQQNPQGHQPLAPVTSHLTTGVTSNHFSQNLPNLLIQPHVSNSSASLLQPTPLHTMPPTLQTPVIQNIMHPGMMHTTHANYEITPIMHASPADNGRHKTAIFEHQEKSLKNSLNDEHIPVHNEATPPPQTMKNSSAADVMRGVSEMEKDPGNGGVLGLHQHQAQIIESVTISPGGPSDGRANHNFKMETM